MAQVGPSSWINEMAYEEFIGEDSCHGAFSLHFTGYFLYYIPAKLECVDCDREDNQ